MNITTRTLPVALVLAALASSAQAGDPQGPAFGAGVYEASIARVCSEPDVDDYVAHLVQGEKLTVTLKVAKGSALMPRLTLVAPDGSEIVPAVSAKSGGKSLTLRAFAVPQSGRWAVRVAGSGGTEGAYSIAFGVAPVADVKLKKLALASADDTRIDFQGVEGALLDVKVSWRPTDPPVTLGRIEDPAHQPVPGVTVTNAKTSFSVKGVALRTGDGTYGLHLLRSAGAPEVSVTLHVAPQGRPVNRKPVRLPDTEPWLEARDAPFRGIGGTIVHMKGGNFSASAPPTVYFGRERVTPMVRAADAIDVIAPQIAAGTTVAVAVVGADGQACVRPDYFHYVAAPSVTDLVDDNEGTVRLGRAAGGDTLWLRGTEFASDQTVYFGTGKATLLSVMNATRMRVVVPPGTGKVGIYVEDPFGHRGSSNFTFDYKSPPLLAAQPFSPPFGALAGGNTITVTGTGFEALDRVVFDGAEIATTFVDSTHIRFVTPARAAGAYSFGVIDRFDGLRSGPDFQVRGAPTITSVVATGGACLDGSHVAAGGGAVVRISGAGFDATNVVRLGGGTGTVISATGTALTFLTGSASIGSAGLVVTDTYGQSVSIGAALELVGWTDETAALFPPASDIDGLTARRGVFADFDGDGFEDDLVIVSANVAPGTRSEFTRLFFHDGAGFTDATESNLPAARSDAARQDDWKALAVAAGDVDGDWSNDIVLAGARVPRGAGGEFEARILRNDGSGTFSPDERAPEVRTERLYCIDTYWGGTYTLFTPTSPNSGTATSVALGDLDGDGDEDLVVGTDRFREGVLHIPLSVVSFSGEMGYANYAGNYYSWSGWTVDSPALRVFENRLDWADDFRDTTFTRLPRSEQTVGTMPAFNSRDLKLADIDDDGDLDIVLTWDDPTTTTPYGLSNPGQDSPRTATRVLVNDGSGVFADETDQWMPAGSGYEYWQADRLALADLDGDGDLDMVLLHHTGTDAFAGTPSHTTPALRVLRNDGAGAGFADVTSSAVPPAPLAGTVNDDLRGSALAVVDFDRDGVLDLVVGTTESLSGSAGGAVRATRLLRGRSGLSFSEVSGFLPPATSDTGEANDVLIGDLSGTSEPTIVLVTETQPAMSAGGGNLRVLGWNE